MKDSRLPYIAGLDGIRALAVLAVLVYHLQPRWLPGGFLGVEVFFAISGYLVTALLLNDVEQHGFVDLRRFWWRRARRLLPACFVLIAAVLAYALLAMPAEAANLRDDALAALFYVTNWHLLVQQQSYFEAIGRPSLLRHLWSLAVEEQFYLLWPLLLGLSLRLLRPLATLLLTLLLAAGSALLMALLYRPDLDPLRVYYGTDTRVAGMLLGAVLAFLWPPTAIPLRYGKATAWQLDGLGLLALLALALSCYWFNEFMPLLYRGGFTLVAIASVVLIAVVVHPNSFLGWGILGSPLLSALGRRSYSIYLWHWPVFAVTRPGLDLPFDGLPVHVLRLCVTLFFAELSYRFVEQPFRSGAVERAWQALWHASGQRRRRLQWRWTMGMLGVGAATASLLVGMAFAPVATPPPYLAALLDAATPSSALAAPLQVTATSLPSSTPQPPTATTTPTMPVLPTTTPALEPTLTPEPSPTAVPPTPEPPPPPGPVYAIGDSVMLGAAGELSAAIAPIEIDAQVSRQVGALIDILRWRASSGLLPDTVVVHIGNNGYFAPGQFDEMMQTLANVRRVIVVNVRVQRPWEGPNNGTINEGVVRYPNAVLLDWYGATEGRYDLFWDDGVHLRPEGAREYAALIASYR
jgi:peptidoglycan/LPS O-acetylase OafA/YrhL